jgi:hypothetical protein
MNKFLQMLILVAAVGSGCATVLPTRHDIPAARSSLNETQCRLGEAIEGVEQALVEHQRLAPAGAGRESWWSQEYHRLTLILVSLERANVETENMLDVLNQRAAQPPVGDCLTPQRGSAP